MRGEGRWGQTVSSVRMYSAPPRGGPCFPACIHPCPRFPSASRRGAGVISSRVVEAEATETAINAAREVRCMSLHASLAGRSITSHMTFCPLAIPALHSRIDPNPPTMHSLVAPPVPLSRRCTAPSRAAPPCCSSASRTWPPWTQCTSSAWPTSAASSGSASTRQRGTWVSTSCSAHFMSTCACASARKRARIQLLFVHACPLSTDWMNELDVRFFPPALAARTTCRRAWPTCWGT